MNKTDLVKFVSDKTKITETDSRIILDVFIKGILKGLKNGNRITISDFGSFFLQERKARTALKPRTQEKIDVPAKTVVRFKSSKKVFDMVNGE